MTPFDEDAAELVRKELRPESRVPVEFPRFVVPEGVPPITLEQTLSADDEA